MSFLKMRTEIQIFTISGRMGKIIFNAFKSEKPLLFRLEFIIEKCLKNIKLIFRLELLILDHCAWIWHLRPAVWRILCHGVGKLLDRHKLAHHLHNGAKVNLKSHLSFLYGQRSGNFWRKTSLIFQKNSEQISLVSALVFKQSSNQKKIQVLYYQPN